MKFFNGILKLIPIMLIAGCSLFNKKDQGINLAADNFDDTFSQTDSTAYDSLQFPMDFDSTAILFSDDAIDRPFYPLQETIGDIQNEMSDLRTRILDYESRIKNQDNSLQALHKIQFPHLTHEIELTNGTLVHGNIVHENSDRMIVKTQIGQLTIDKSTVAQIKSISPNYPEVEFEGDPLDEIYMDHRVFSGKVYNDGFRRADFVRVIFKLWSEKTELIGMDSSYVEGSNFTYESGVISDTSIEPSQSAEYIVSVQADSSMVRYVTREIKWDIFE